jgi:hypothetical protein
MGRWTAPDKRRIRSARARDTGRIPRGGERCEPSGRAAPAYCASVRRPMPTIPTTPVLHTPTSTAEKQSVLSQSPCPLRGCPRPPVNCIPLQLLPHYSLLRAMPRAKTLLIPQPHPLRRSALGAPHDSAGTLPRALGYPTRTTAHEAGRTDRGHNLALRRRRRYHAHRQRIGPVLSGMRCRRSVPCPDARRSSRPPRTLTTVMTMMVANETKVVKPTSAFFSKRSAFPRLRCSP